MSRLTEKPVAYNLIAGGKTPSVSFQDLRGAGVTLVLYSTPCLFAAQAAVERAVQGLKMGGGLLPDKSPTAVTLRDCVALL